MRDYFKAKTWVITIFMFVVAFGLSLAVVYYELGFRENVKISSAGSSDNVSGWAWNSNIGWISFSCSNNNTCSDNGGYDYGVNIDSDTGDFSGYAWSSNVGWVYFGPDDNLPVYGLIQASDAPGDPKIWAHYDSATGIVTGWAKILSMGNNGWVKLSDSSWASGVSINSTTGDFSGWAWNANDDKSGIGWVSFNCDHRNDGTLPPNNIDTCATLSNYKVTLDTSSLNNPPEVKNLTAPNWANHTPPSVNALGAKLQFDFIDTDSGSSGSAYKIIVNRASDNFEVLNTGECTNVGVPSADCKIGIDCMINGSTGCPNAGDCVCTYNIDESKLAYDTSYKWSVQVWDNNDVYSATTSFDTNISGHILTDNQAYNEVKNPINPNLTFTTYKHKFPQVNATYFPVNPSLGEEVKFTDDSRIYLTSDPDAPVNCTDALCDWSWSATNGATFKDNDTATSTPTIIFNSNGSSTVTLTVTDTDGYSASYQILVSINAQLPKWKEVKPE
ncbi:MAG: hypothetical protein WCV70_04315 [Patescibacteria group bacterium]|jgi:hypothetical protein